MAVSPHMYIKHGHAHLDINAIIMPHTPECSVSLNRTVSQFLNYHYRWTWEAGYFVVAILNRVDSTLYSQRDPFYA